MFPAGRPCAHSESAFRILHSTFFISNRPGACFDGDVLPCVIFEDDQLLVVNKPAGMNTHAPDPFAGEGIYDWLRHREPRWARLAIQQRLDKETSGVMVFTKTELANRSLALQFERRTIRKKYILLTDRRPKSPEFVVKTRIARRGDRYASAGDGQPAETRFKVRPFESASSNLVCLEAEPLTGRTHQIRVHAAENGFPILGDRLYGGAAFGRVCLHAAQLALRHPAHGGEAEFLAPVDFFGDARAGLRTGLIDPDETNACRLIHGASDGWRGWYVERLGDFLLSQSDHELEDKQLERLRRLAPGRSRPAGLETCRGVYHLVRKRQAPGAGREETAPRRVLGESAPEFFPVLENGLRFELSFGEGSSVGLFLDQRENRRRLLTGHIAEDFPGIDVRKDEEPRLQVLNTFAYTCGFSVCAARFGARTTSLDLSRKYLEWGKRNFRLNGLDSDEHEFIYGDAFDWLRRLAKKQRRFDVIVIDPPTFSVSKARGAFRVEVDYGELVGTALGVLRRGGVLFASTNAAGWAPDKFLAAVEKAVRSAKRTILNQHYVPQPADFPISRVEPAYLKTVWMRIE